jgi:hypothetical protein
MLVCGETVQKRQLLFGSNFHVHFHHVISTFVILVQEAQPPNNAVVNSVENSCTPPYFDREVTEYLTEISQGIWIRRDGTVAWPAPSHVLTP